MNTVAADSSWGGGDMRWRLFLLDMNENS
jgi:hypothetical protein